MWGDIPEWAEDIARALMMSLKVKDPITFYHCCRVGKASGLLAKSVGLNQYEQKVAEFAGLFHDIGKIAISHDVLHKPGKLSDEEYKKVKEHPLTSAEMIAPIGHAFFKDLLPGIQHHHERIDGLGYPFNLKGDDIPLMARLILVVDTCDAMSQTRSYRKGLPIEVVYKEIEKFSGQQFDSQLAKVFLESHPHWYKEETKGDVAIVERLFKNVA